MLAMLMSMMNQVSTSIPKSDRVSKSISHGHSTALHIGGLFPISGTSGWLGGQGTYPGEYNCYDNVNLFMIINCYHEQRLVWL